MSYLANQQRLMKVILGPHVSEKTSAAADSNRQIVFKVRPDATKREVKQAVELLFEVKVDKVRVINVRGKIKRHGLTSGRLASWKKAYISLAPGSDIDFMGVE